MARIYNPTMLMLDPSNVMSGMRLGREREAEERATRQGILSGVKSLGESAGRIVGRAIRQSEIGDVPDNSDEEWKAVVERFVDTGDVSGINAYRQRQAEQAYRDKMAEIQKMEAEGAKTSAKASLKEQGLKERQMQKEKIDEAKYELETAINSYMDAKTEGSKRKAKTDYEYAKKRLKNLNVPDYEIRPLSFNDDYTGEEAKGKEAKGKEVETEETGAEETKRPFTSESYAGKKNDITNRLNEKFNTQGDIDKVVDELTALSQTEFGAEDKELIGLFDKARKIVPEDKKAEIAFMKKVKIAKDFENLKPRQVQTMKEEDFQNAKKIYEEMSKRTDWEQLKTKVN